MDESGGRRGRRRRRMERQDGMEKKNGERSNGSPTLSQSSDRLFRRDTYVLSRVKSDVDVVSGDHSASDGLKVSSLEGSVAVKDVSPPESQKTYNLDKVSDRQESKHDTYNVEKSGGAMENRPIPAPRRINLDLTVNTPEKVSSDTDKDVADIDMDEVRMKSDTDSKSHKKTEVVGHVVTSGSDNSIVVPVPKPRRKKPASQESLTAENPVVTTDVPQQKPEAASVPPPFPESPKECDTSKPGPNEPTSEKDKTASSPVSKTTEVPLVDNMPPCEFTLTSEKEVRKRLKMQKKLRLADLVEKKGKKKKSTRMFPSLMKTEKGKVPTISAEDTPGTADEKSERYDEDEDNADFRIDSPQYPRSVDNGMIYVQDKNGFYMLGREEVLKRDVSKKSDGTTRTMPGSTVRTAILFQKYWSRTMMYFHGILAGFALGHAAMVTAIIVHFNYDPDDFIGVYACLSLKIHFIFYTLTTFCIVSCFDRIDIGHINRKHWEIAWKVPSMWSVLCLYIISFVLTFCNHKTEVRFDSYQYVPGNETDVTIWNTRFPNEIQLSLLTWFHIIWARDVLLLLAWFIISLTKFSDFLCGHLNNMIKYAQINDKD